MNARRALVVLIAVAAIGGAVFVIGTTFLAREIVTGAEEPRTPKNGDYRPVARDLALLAQTLDAPLSGLGHGWLPKSARDLHPQMATVGPDGASLSWGRDYGGSLTVRREAPDAGGDRVTWVLTRSSYQNKDGKDGVMVRVVLGRSERRPLRDFIAETQASYAEALQTIDWRSDHFSRVLFALRFQSREEARALLVDSVARFADDPDPRMGLALFDAADGKQEGIKQLEAWAAAKPSFARHSDVALVYATMGRVDDALAALERALQHRLTVDGWYMNHATARSIPVLDLAFSAQRYDRVDALAAIVSERETDWSAKQTFDRDLRALRAASLFLRGDRARAVDLVPDALREPDAFYRGAEEEKREALAQAIRAGDEAGVRAWKPIRVGSHIVGSLVGGDDALRVMTRGVFDVSGPKEGP